MKPDEVSGKVLIECKEQQVTPIYRIIKSSLKDGKCPKNWKKAIIVPIYKRKDRENSLNYRPISLPTVETKKYKKVIKDK